MKEDPTNHREAEEVEGVDGIVNELKERRPSGGGSQVEKV